MRRVGVGWLMLLAWCTWCGAQACAAIPAEKRAQVLRKAVLVVPFRSTHARGANERYLGVGAAHVLDHVLALHDRLEDGWGYLYARRLFSSRGDLERYVQGEGKDDPALDDIEVRWTVRGEVLEQGARLVARVTMHDRAAGRTWVRLLPLDVPALVAFRSEFLALLAQAGIPLPARQRARAGWKESLSRAALAQVGRGLLPCYWDFPNETARWDPKPFRVAPESYVARDALGWALLRQPQLPEARKILLQALRLNPAGRHAAIGMLESAVASHERATVERWARRQAEMAGRDVRSGLARGVTALADDLLDSDASAALPLFQAALAQARQAGDRGAQAAALRGSGMACESLGRHDEAVRHLRQALPEAQAVADVDGEMAIQAALGGSLVSAQLFDEAVPCLEQALALARKLNDRSAQGHILAHLGGAYDSLSQFEKAVQACQAGQVLLHEAGDAAGEAVALGNLGLALDNLGRAKEAVACYERALPLAREGKERAQEAVVLANLAGCVDRLGQHEAALEYLEKALAIAVETRDHEREAAILLVTGLAQAHLSRYGAAMASLERSLVLEREMGDRRGEAATLANMGLVREMLGEHSAALEQFEKARALLRDLKDRAAEATTMSNIAVALQGLKRHAEAVAVLEKAAVIQREVKDRSGLAASLVNLGISLVNLDRDAEAVAPLQQSLALCRDLGEPSGESSALAVLGRLYARRGDAARAEACLWQSLALARTTGDRTLVAVALGGLVDVARRSSRPALAILLGKMCVNAWQEVRREMRSLARESRESFVQDKEQDYRGLADLLIDQGRLDEAERVIGLLKDEEYARDVRGAAAGNAATAPLTPREDEWRTRYEGLVGRLGSVAAAYDALDGLRLQRALTTDEKRRLVALQGDLDASQVAYRRFLDEMSRQTPATGDGTDRIRAVRQDEDLKALLADLGDHAVILYTLVTADSYHVILVTPSFQEVFTSPVSGERLNGMVANLRRTLARPTSDPRDAAHALYDVMVGRALDRTGKVTLAERLRQYGAQTLMWELDGALRYCPVAALHDGQAYLVERYASAVFTPASRINLREVPDPKAWSALGLGVSVPLDGFPALASVEGELKAIIRDPKGEGGSGVMPGRVLVNGAFTRESMREALLDRYRVVHVASHFSFEPGEGGKSFLLLGQGTPPRLSLADLAGWGASPFRGVDLLTLSACNTAVGGTGAAGREVENLAVAAQDKGARAVLATLWEVDDPSTRAFMEAFYRTMRAGGSSKAAAVRAAQLALLRGGASTSAEGAGNPSIGPQAGGKGDRGQPQNKPASTQRRAGRLSTSGSGPENPRRETNRDDSPWSHPYYWAPFVLIGNWK